MFKIGSFENEILLGMEKSLRANQSEESNQGFNKLAKAVDFLNNAASIFDQADMHKEASEITNILQKIAQDNYSPLKRMDALAPREEESKNSFFQKNFQKMDSLIKSMAAGTGVEVNFREISDWGTGWRISIPVPYTDEIVAAIAAAKKTGASVVDYAQMPKTKRMLDQYVNKCNAQIITALNAQFPGWNKFAIIAIHANVNREKYGNDVPQFKPFGTYLGSGTGYHENFNEQPDQK